MALAYAVKIEGYIMYTLVKLCCASLIILCCISGQLSDTITPDKLLILFFKGDFII